MSKKKKGKKQTIPFGGVVAEVAQTGNLYWVSIQQTPGAHAALNKAMDTLKMGSHNLTLEQAKFLMDTVNEEYQRNPNADLR